MQGFWLRQVLHPARSAEFGSGQISSGFPDFAGLHYPHNGCGAEMLIFLKHDGHLLNLD